MSKENIAHLDAAIVNTLQEDTIASRRTVEWITNGVVKLPAGVPYNVLPRKLAGAKRTRVEIDVALENVSFVLTSIGECFVATLHAEVEASGVMSPARMFSYDYELARKYYKGNGPLVFPVSYAVLLRHPPKGASGIDGIHAVDSMGTLICNYHYQVRYLAEDSYGTLIGPVAVAAEKTSDPAKHTEQILSAMRAAAEGIDKPAVQDDYLRHMSLGLTQRFGELGAALREVAEEDPISKRAFDNIVSVFNTEGRSVMMRNLFEEAREEGRQEVREEVRRSTLEEAITNIMKSLGLTREQAEKAVCGESQRSGASKMNLI